MKLVEGVVVAGTPITNSTIGTSQIIFNDPEVDDVNTMARFLGVKSNVKNKEEKTYLNTTDDVIVAYVLDSACNNIAALYGKAVDVIFGKDNKVAYIALTDDAMDGFVTAWDGEEIEIDGEVYEFADSFVVTVYSTAIGTAANDIDDLFTALNIADADRTFNRTVKANVVLTEDGEIEKIDFMFAEDYAATNKVKVENYIVKSISSKGKINAIKSGSNILGGEFEDIEEDVRVIKNNEIVSLEDIEVGDVLTLVSKYATSDYELTTVYVSSNRAEGEITRLKNNSYTLDGEDVYYTVKTVIGDSNGDIEDAENVTLKDYYGEEVEFYLNYMGEVVAVVANTDAVDSTLGIVTSDSTVKTDDNDVDYLSVRILTEDGETVRYKVYNKKTSDNYDEATTYNVKFAEADAVTEDDDNDAIELKKGAVVIFSADADNVIKSDKIEVVDLSTANGAEFEIGATTVVGVAMSSVDDLSNSKKKVTIGSNDYKFAGATLYNNKAGDEEVMKGWSSLCNDDTTKATFGGYNGMAFVKKTDSTSKTVLYYVAALSAYETEEAEYAVLVDVEYTTNDDDEDVYVATLYVDGEEVEYEVDVDQVTDLDDFSSFDFVTFELSDGEIVDLTKVIDIYDLAKVEAEEEIDNEIVGLTLDHKALLEVENVYDTYIEYVAEYNCGDDICEAAHVYANDLDINEDGYIIYDLRDGFAMFDGTLVDVEGLYVYGFETEAGEGYDVFVIFE